MGIDTFSARHSKRILQVALSGPLHYVSGGLKRMFMESEMNGIERKTENHRFSVSQTGA